MQHPSEGLGYIQEVVESNDHASNLVLGVVLQACVGLANLHEGRRDTAQERGGGTVEVGIF